MKLLTPLAVLTAFASFAVAAHFAQPDPASPAAESKRLNQALEQAACRAAEKQRVTAEVIAGRLTLAEAADQFERLGVGSLGVHDAPPTTRETASGNVITWVKASLAEAPDGDSGVVSRLEAEYRDSFGHARPTL